MRVYVESNFVLKLALAQEQAASCEGILAYRVSGGAELVVPAYAMAEPFEALTRRGRERERLKGDLDRKLTQLARSDRFAERAPRLRDLTGFPSATAAVEGAQLDGTGAHGPRTLVKQFSKHDRAW